MYLDQGLGSLAVVITEKLVTINESEVLGEAQSVGLGAGAARPDQHHAVHARRAHHVVSVPRVLQPGGARADRVETLRRYLIDVVIVVDVHILEEILLIICW